MDDLTNICLSCGYCCDGTIVGFVQIDGDELPVLKELMDVEDANVGGFFLQPCQNYCDGCQIYSDRPKQCASFECGLLKSVDQKELDFDSAIDIIEEVKQKKIAIEIKLANLDIELQSQSFYFKMIELNKLLQLRNAELSLTQNQLELMSEINQLDSLIAARFDTSIF